MIKPNKENKKTKMHRLKFLVAEIPEKDICYYYDGKELSKQLRIYRNWQLNVIKAEMQEEDYMFMITVDYKGIYKEKSKPLGRPANNNVNLYGGDGCRLYLNTKHFT